MYVPYRAVAKMIWYVPVVLALLHSHADRAAAQPSVQFTSSNLPIVVIDTWGQTIVNEPKITCEMGIIDNGEGMLNYVTDPLNDYNGLIGIEIRGSSSQMFPKKQYGLETRDPAGADSSASLLGLPPESDWILSAPYSDKSLIRDALTYTLARKMGRYASRARFCEVVINGEYMGVYVLFEKIKRGNDRVDISKLTPADTSDDQLTGGYIVKVDKLDGAETDGWESGLPPYPGAWQKVYYQFHYPAYSELLPSQSGYIERWIRDFEVAMELETYADTALGYPRYLDVMSFVDGVLMNELTKNVDAYRLSTFLHKDRDSKGGRLVLGPLWDFNHSLGNCDYYSGSSADGFVLIALANDSYFLSSDWWQPPFWWKKLFEDPDFAALMRDRWWELRGGVLSTPSVESTIDSLFGLLSEAQARNFERWPVLGEYVWPNAFIGQTYAEEMQYLKSWVSSRVQWLDAEFDPSGVRSQDGSMLLPEQIELRQNYPNPFNAGTEISYRIPEAARVRLTLYDMLGREVSLLVQEELEAGIHRARVDAGNLASGVYMYRLQVQPLAAGGTEGSGSRSQGSSLTKSMVLIR